MADSGDTLALAGLSQAEDFADRKVAYRRAEKGLELVREALELLGPNTDAAEALAALHLALERLRPLPPRRCKEYRRALARESKGLLGIRPHDVVLYCPCAECDDLRARFSLEQPRSEDAETFGPLHPEGKKRRENWAPGDETNELAAGDA